MGRAAPKKDPALARLKRGCGSGTGCDYKPWLGPRDGGRKGNVHRVLGWKTGRVHVLFGGIELGFFYLAEWSDEVVDIREQYPLDRSGTLAIAADIGIRHPTVVGTRFSYTMSTDFLLTVMSPVGERYIAVDCKRECDLDDLRVREKLEIHRRYWALRDIPWNLVVEKDLPPDLIRNLAFLHPRRSLGGIPLSGRDPECLLAALGGRLREQPEGTPNLICREFDRDHGLPEGFGLALVRYALATKRWGTDLTRRLDFTRPMTLTGC
jgi:hypothetical protein